MPHAPFTRADPDVRRLSLIEATARVLAAGGTAGASVRTIAREANVSPGLVGHYFDGVDTLIAATYDHVGKRVGAALDSAIAVAGRDSRTRLDAYVTASFSPQIADPDLLATWLAFWSLVRTQPRIGQLHDEIYESYRGQLEILLAACGVLPSDLRLTAIAIAALVDGLWLELCLSPDTFSPREACAIATRQTAFILADSANNHTNAENNLP